MGATLGLALGTVGLLRAYVTPADTYADGQLVQIMMTIGLAVFVVVLCGNLVGALAPLLLKRFGFDPALMSNPVVASLVDVTGIVTYFGIAQAILL